MKSGFLAVMLGLGLNACAGKTNSSAPAAANHEARGIRVTFISFGAGPDTRIANSVDSLIQSARENKKKVNTVTKPLEGDFEGGYKLCIEMESTELRDQMLEAVMGAVGRSQQVTAEATEDCQGAEWSI